MNFLRSAKWFLPGVYTIGAAITAEVAREVPLWLREAAVVMGIIASAATTIHMLRQSLKK